MLLNVFNYLSKFQLAEQKTDNISLNVLPGVFF